MLKSAAAAAGYIDRHIVSYYVLKCGGVVVWSFAVIPQASKQ